MMRLALILFLLLSACSSADEETGTSLTAPQKSALTTPVIATEQPTDVAAEVTEVPEQRYPVWQEKARLGNGTAWDIVWSPDGTWLAINGALGTWRYELSAPDGSPALMDVWTSIEAFYGARVVARDQEKVLRVWDTATGESLFALESGSLQADSPVFSADGTWLAVVVIDTGEQRRTLAPSVLAPPQATIQVWDVEAGTRIASYAMPEETFLGMRFDADGRLLVAGSVANGIDWESGSFQPGEGPDYFSDDFGIRLWDIAADEQLAEFLGLSGPPSKVLFSPDGSRLVATLNGTFGGFASDDHSVVVWDTETQEIVRRFDPQSQAATHSFTLSAGGRLLAAPREAPMSGTGLPEWERGIWVWNLDTGQEQVRLTDERLVGVAQSSQGLYGLSFSPDETRLAALNSDGTLWVWDVETGEVLRVVDFFSTPVDKAAFSPDGQTVLCASWDGTVIAWDVNSLERRFKIQVSQMSSFFFVPDGSFVVQSWAYGMPMRRFDIRTGEELESLEVNPTVGNVVFSPNGEIMATNGGSGAVSLRNLNTGELIGAIMTPHSITSLAFNDDGSVLATGGADGTIALWDVATRNEIKRLEGHTGGIANLIFRADGAQLVSVSLSQATAYEEVIGDNTLRVWDVEQGKLLETVPLDPDIDWFISVLSPDGRWLVTNGAWDDPTAKVWDVRTGDVVAVLGGTDNGVNGLAFSADGSLLLAHGGDGVLRLWAVE